MPLPRRLHGGSPRTSSPVVTAEQAGSQRCPRHRRHDAPGSLQADARQEPSLAIAAQHAAARKTFVGDVHRCNLTSKVETVLADLPELRPAMAPSLEPRSMMRKKKKELNWQLAARAPGRRLPTADDDPRRQPGLAAGKSKARSFLARVLPGVASGSDAKALQEGGPRCIGGWVDWADRLRGCDKNSDAEEELVGVGDRSLRGERGTAPRGRARPDPQGRGPPDPAYVRASSMRFRKSGGSPGPAASFTRLVADTLPHVRVELHAPWSLRHRVATDGVLLDGAAPNSSPGVVLRTSDSLWIRTRLGSTSARS